MKTQGMIIQNTRNIHKANFRVVITKVSDNEFLAEIPSISHCMASGETLDQAMHNINEVLDAMLEIMHEDSMPIPDDTHLIEYSITKDLALQPS